MLIKKRRDLLRGTSCFSLFLFVMYLHEDRVNQTDRVVVSRIIGVANNYDTCKRVAM